jgi:hypothetical protein
MALVDILVYVCDASHGDHVLTINVATVLPNEILDVCDHIVVVHISTSDIMLSAIIAMTGSGIGIYSHGSLLMELFGKSLGASSCPGPQGPCDTNTNSSGSSSGTGNSLHRRPSTSSGVHNFDLDARKMMRCM